MFRLTIVCVGKTKKSYWLDAIAHYEKMLRAVLRVDAVHVKDCPNAQGEERKRLESERILERLGPRDTLIALHEAGTLYSSMDFATMLRPLLEAPQGSVVLAVGGALGHSPELLSRARMLLSLSPLTMPHDLALVVLYEQLFRATTIISGRTYHY